MVIHDVGVAGIEFATGKFSGRLHCLQRRAQQRFVKREGYHIPEDYGLITVLPSEGADEGQQRMVVISSLTSAGAQAAAEFFSSPQQLQVLQEKLQAEGHRAFPASWQVIIKTTEDVILPLSYSYVAHRVMQP